MPTVDAVVECPVYDSFRVEQVRGMFDLPAAAKATAHFSVEVPGPEEEWSVGLIVGPSGSGKSTIAREAFGADLYAGGDWPADKAVVDCFGPAGIKDVVQTLSSVGLSSPPSWVKPYAVLSNGEKFRCDLARALMGEGGIVVFDEFTSVVDRTVAKIGSAAVAKAVRAGRVKKRFVAVSCHYDIAEWLEPDWVVDMATQELARGRLQRPQITLEIVRVDTSAWQLFKRHHYLNTTLHRNSKCFLGLVDGCPAAFTGVISFCHPVRSGWKEHRTVCLPDFQGLGIGNKLSEFVAGLFRATGKPYFSTTSHPAMMRYRARSGRWRMIRKPSLCKKNKGAAWLTKEFHKTQAADRMTAGFEFAGPPLREEAERFGVIPAGGPPAPQPRKAPASRGRGRV